MLFLGELTDSDLVSWNWSNHPDSISDQDDDVGDGEDSKVANSKITSLEEEDQAATNRYSVAGKDSVNCKKINKEKEKDCRHITSFHSQNQFFYIIELVINLFYSVLIKLTNTLD